MVSKDRAYHRVLFEREIRRVTRGDRAMASNSAMFSRTEQGLVAVQSVITLWHTNVLCTHEYSEDMEADVRWADEEGKVI